MMFTRFIRLSTLVVGFAGTGCGQPEDSAVDEELLEARVARAGSCPVDNGGCDIDATCTQIARKRVSCACNAGFVGNGIRCRLPRTSCRSENGGCDANAICAQVRPKVVSCACKSGYVGDGYQCQPVGGCNTEFGFESGGLGGWDFSRSDPDVSTPAISSNLAHTGTRSLATSLPEGSFAQFRMLRDVCPGATADLSGKNISFWVRWEGFPSTPPDTFSGCEALTILPDGTFVQVTDRVLWPVGSWHNVASGRNQWGVVRGFGIYCVVNGSSGGGTLHIDDIRIE